MKSVKNEVYEEWSLWRMKSNGVYILKLMFCNSYCNCIYVMHEPTKIRHFLVFIAPAYWEMRLYRNVTISTSGIKHWVGLVWGCTKRQWGEEKAPQSLYSKLVDQLRLSRVPSVSEAATPWLVFTATTDAVKQINPAVHIYGLTK